MKVYLQVTLKLGTYVFAPRWAYIYGIYLGLPNKIKIAITHLTVRPPNRVESF